MTCGNSNNIGYVKTSPYIVNTSDDILNIDTSVIAITLLLPNIASSGIRTKRFYINDISGNASTNNITIQGIGGNLINGGNSLVLNTNSVSAETVIANNNEYLINNDGSSGGSNYTGSSPTTLTVGGITAGTTIASSTVSDILQAMLVPFIAPAFSSFSIGQTSPIEVGTTISGAKTFSWATSQSGNVQANSIKIKDVTAGVFLATGLANDGSESVSIGSINNTTATSYSWRGEATNTQSTTFVSSNTTVSWRFRMFYGTSASVTLNAGAIQALANNPLVSSFGGTFAFVANDYKYICYPDSFGSPTASTGFKDSSTNLAVDMATVVSDPFYSNLQNGWYYGLVSVTNGLGVTANYRVYRTANQLGSTINIIVS